MIVLGIDTATSATAVALRCSDGSTGEARDDPAPGAHPGHATRLLGMTDELLGQAGLEARDVQRIAVGAGPGTFTGLRVGLATARGLAQTLGVELLAVSSLRALARGVLDAESAAPARPVLAVIDARRSEIFASAFGPAGEVLAAARALSPEAAPELLAEAGLSGPGVPLGIGDGALRYREALERAGVEVPAEGSPLHLLRAGAICALAVDATPPAGYGQVLPDYLRRPDAELALEGATSRGRAS